MLYVRNAPKGELVTHLVENGAVITREDQYALRPADLWAVRSCSIVLYI